MPGTPQPAVAMSIGIKDLPLRPEAAEMRSIMKATWAI